MTLGKCNHTVSNKERPLYLLKRRETDKCIIFTETPKLLLLSASLLASFPAVTKVRTECLNPFVTGDAEFFISWMPFPSSTALKGIVQ